MEGSANLWCPSRKVPFKKEDKIVLVEPDSASNKLIDVFVSHQWFDTTYIADAEKSSKGNGEIFYWDMKTSGIIKATNSLVARNLKDFENKPKEEWRFWVDRVCVDQERKDMKIHATKNFELYIQISKALVVLVSPEYFERLWCVFEYSSFIFYHDMKNIAVYAWGKLKWVVD